MDRYPAARSEASSRAPLRRPDWSAWPLIARRRLSSAPPADRAFLLASAAGTLAFFLALLLMISDGLGAPKRRPDVASVLPVATPDSPPAAAPKSRRQMEAAEPLFVFESRSEIANHALQTGSVEIEFLTDGAGVTKPPERVEPKPQALVDVDGAPEVWNALPKDMVPSLPLEIDQPLVESLVEPELPALNSAELSVADSTVEPEPSPTAPATDIPPLNAQAPEVHVEVPTLTMTLPDLPDASHQSEVDEVGTLDPRAPEPRADVLSLPDVTPHAANDLPDQLAAADELAAEPSVRAEVLVADLPRAKSGQRGWSSRKQVAESPPASAEIPTASAPEADASSAPPMTETKPAEPMAIANELTPANPSPPASAWSSRRKAKVTSGPAAPAEPPAESEPKPAPAVEPSPPSRPAPAIAPTEPEAATQIEGPDEPAAESHLVQRAVVAVPEIPVTLGEPSSVPWKSPDLLQADSDSSPDDEPIITPVAAPAPASRPSTPSPWRSSPSKRTAPERPAAPPPVVVSPPAATPSAPSPIATPPDVPPEPPTSAPPPKAPAASPAAEPPLAMSPKPPAPEMERTVPRRVQPAPQPVVPKPTPQPVTQAEPPAESSGVSAARPLDDQGPAAANKLVCEPLPPRDVAAGQPFTLVVRVSNPSSESVTDAALVINSDWLPASFQPHGVLLWVGDLAAGQTQQVALALIAREAGGPEFTVRARTTDGDSTPRHLTVRIAARSETIQMGCNPALSFRLRPW